jgi:hypothetical protein
LTQDEFEEHLKKKFSEYHRVMAPRFIENTEKEYWKYQQQELQKLAYQFDLLRVLLGTFRECVSHPRWGSEPCINQPKQK